MAFGFGDGKIEVQLDKPVYNIGETIKARCSLKLKQPVDARSLISVLQRMEKRGKVPQPVEIGRKPIESAARAYKDGEEFEFSFFIVM